VGLRTLAAAALLSLLTGCGPRLKGSEASERQAAVNKITDQHVLGDLAQNCAQKTGYTDVCLFAIRRLTDQSLLFKLAMEGSRADGDGASFDRARAAVETLNDQNLLTKVAQQARDWDIRALALQRIPGQEKRGRLMAEANDYNDDEFRRCTASLKLALLEPVIASRFPRIQYDGHLRPKSAGYVGDRMCSVTGEDITIQLVQDGRIIAKGKWSSGFDGAILSDECGTHIAAEVHCADVMQQLLKQSTFTPEDLSELSDSSNLDVSTVAHSILTVRKRAAHQN
jgi:hypothetical protein